MSNQLVNYIMSDETINLVTSDNGVVSVPKEDARYSVVKTYLRQGRYKKAMEAIAPDAVKMAKWANGEFEIRDGLIWHHDQPMSEGLTKRILEFHKNKLDYKPLVKFHENLMQNPSKDSRKDLYAFLEANQVPITTDGYFLGYKRVLSDMTSGMPGVYTRTATGWTYDPNTRLRHVIGEECWMPREEVDPERGNTCSKGLHVAAFEYASSFYNDGILLEVKVNPRDVVAVPPDYDQQKMRTCGYVPMNIISGRRDDSVHLIDENWQEVESEVNVGDLRVELEELEDELLDLKNLQANGQNVYESIKEVEDKIDNLEIKISDLEDESYDEYDEYDEDDEYDEVEVEDEDEDEVEVEDNDERIVTRTVKAANDGRLTIPADLCRKMGLKGGDTAFVSMAPTQLTVRKSPNAMFSNRAYKVSERDNSFAISQAARNTANIKGDTFTVEGTKDFICITKA